MIQVLIATAASVFASASFAVINGYPAHESSTVELQVGRKRCSAVLTGTQPITILTAAACLKDRATVQIRHQPIGLDPKVKAILKNGSLAVLVFDQAGTGCGDGIPIAKRLEPAEPIEVCGFGHEHGRPDRGVASCGRERLVEKPTELSTYLPNDYGVQDSKLFSFYRANLRSVFRDSDRGLMAISRNLYNRYALEDPMPTYGDIGGPWFAVDRLGRRKIIGITTQIRTLQRRNDKWIIFNDETLAENDLPYVAVGLRLDTPEARELFERAQRAGADLRND